METDYIDLKTLSKRLGLSPRTVRARVNDPVQPLPAYRVGGKTLFRWIEVERWMQQFRVKPVDVDEMADRVMDKVKGSRGAT